MNWKSGLKIFAGAMILFGIIFSYLELKYAPHAILDGSSPEYPDWLKWIAWAMASVGAISYIVLDLWQHIERKRLSKPIKCRVKRTKENDIAAWVTKEAFLANVNEEDWAFRESKEVIDCYHPDWFYHDDNGELYFIPPAVVLRDQFFEFINGRTRAKLLFRHLEVIPMLLANPEKWPKDKLNEFSQKEIGEDELVELPHLPGLPILKEQKA